MRQLTSLDAQLLALENDTHYGHVAGVAVLDPSTAPGGRLDLSDIALLIAERLAFARAARLTFSLASSGAARPAWNLVVSRRARPPVPALLRRRPARGQLPGVGVTDGMGLNITVMSYCGHLDFGLVADREAMPDLWRLMDWLTEALSELELEGPREGVVEPVPEPSR